MHEVHSDRPTAAAAVAAAAAAAATVLLFRTLLFALIRLAASPRRRRRLRNASHVCGFLLPHSRGGGGKEVDNEFAKIILLCWYFPFFMPTKEEKSKEFVN